MEKAPCAQAGETAPVNNFPGELFLRLRSGQALS